MRDCDICGMSRDFNGCTGMADGTHAEALEDRIEEMEGTIRDTVTYLSEMLPDRTLSTSSTAELVAIVRNLRECIGETNA